MILVLVAIINPIIVHIKIHDAEATKINTILPITRIIRLVVLLRMSNSNNNNDKQ